LIDPPPFASEDSSPAAPLPITVRTAHPGDRATIVAFNARLAAESEGKALDPAVLARGVEQALADPDRLHYWVAEVRDGEGARARVSIVGQAAVNREWSDWRNGWIWWLQSVYVHPDYRRRGVFRALHQQIKHAARAAGDVTGIRLYVENANTPAQRTYAAVGFAPGGYQVYEEFWIGRPSSD
jgi:GNAT superfamily N-acetyltransferase